MSLDVLGLEPPCPQRRTDELLVSIHRRLAPGAAGIADAALPVFAAGFAPAGAHGLRARRCVTPFNSISARRDNRSAATFQDSVIAEPLDIGALTKDLEAGRIDHDVHRPFRKTPRNGDRKAAPTALGEQRLVRAAQGEAQQGQQGIDEPLQGPEAKLVVQSQHQTGWQGHDNTPRSEGRDPLELPPHNLLSFEPPVSRGRLV